MRENASTRDFRVHALAGKEAVRRVSWEKIGELRRVIENTDEQEAAIRRGRVNGALTIHERGCEVIVCVDCGVQFPRRKHQTWNIRCPFCRQGGFRNSKLECIRSMVAAGMTRAEIAVELGVSERRIKRWMPIAGRGSS
jgi:hypothetical protein